MGYKPKFLAVDVKMPIRDGLIDLSYMHFSVSMDVDRRLAASSGVNIDGSALREVERSDNWRLDDRLPEDQQAGPELYSNNDLDRGHLVRRRDPVWGTMEEATTANSDTFHYTVCAPQTATLNQSKTLWLGLEDYVLEHARQYDQLLSVFTGCVFADDDPVYRDVPIPRQFYKVAAWVRDGNLEATGYVLDQSRSLDPIVERGVLPDETPPLGAYRTFQVPIGDIAELTGLEMSELVDADRLAVVTSARPIAWTELHASSDLVF